MANRTDSRFAAGGGGHARSGAGARARGSWLASAVAVCGLALAASGCPEDPNKNSMTYPSGDAGTPSGSGGGGVQAGTGGSTNMGPIVGTPIVTFDSTTEGFAIEAYHDLAQVNLGDPASVATTPPTISLDDTQGSPTAGSLKVTAPYSGASQYVDIQKSIQANPQNWMGKTMHVRIKVTSGTFRGGVQLYAKTGMAFVFGGTYINFGPGSGWQEFTLNVTSPMTIIPGYDPTRVFSFGLQLNTGSAGAAATPVTFNIDSFSIDPPLPAAADAGSDAADAQPGAADAGASSDAATD